MILNDIFHIWTEAFQVGGGLFLFSVGLSMAIAKNSDDKVKTSNTAQNVACLIIKPLTTPIGRLWNDDGYTSQAHGVAQFLGIRGKFLSNTCGNDDSRLLPIYCRV
jgi:hypothetical protein